MQRPSWLPPSIFPFQSRFVAIDGKWIHYIDEGSGPALLFVSAGWWSFMFRDVILRLRARFRCLTLDFPGSQLERSLETTLVDVPVLTLFGRRSDRHGWQEHFGRTFRNVTTVALVNGHRFPFNDDPDQYARAISDWWLETAAPAERRSDR